MEGEVTDKYNRLLQEYSKAKAQNAVLKKAVLTEQEKVETLQNALKNKDQLLRKAAQEQDQLSFHNEVLMKRVASLQSELSEPKSRGSWISLNKQELRRQNEVLEATTSDLQAKISENEALHSKLKEVTTGFAKKVDLLERQCKDLQKELASLKASSGREISDKTTELTQLRARSFELEKDYFNAKQDAEMASLRHAAFERQATEKLQKLEQDVRMLQERVRQKVMFDDTLHEESNQLNVATFDPKLYRDLGQILEKGTFVWEQLSSALTLFHEAYQARVLVLLGTSTSEELVHVNTTLHHLLGKKPEAFRTMEGTIASFATQFKTMPHQRKGGQAALPSFHPGMAEVLRYYQELIPALILSIKEESSRGGQGVAVRSRNDLVVETLSGTLGVIERMTKRLDASQGDAEPHLLASNPSRGPTSEDEEEEEEGSLLHLLEELSTNFKVLSTQMASKLTAENRAGSPPELKASNERILLSLGGVVSSLGLIHPLFEERNAVVENSKALRVRGAPVSKELANCGYLGSAFESKARQFMARVKIEPFPSVPYKEALECKSLMLTSSQSQREMSNKLSQYMESLQKLEREKEALQLDRTVLEGSLKEHERRAQEHLATVAGLRDEVAHLRTAAAERQALLERTQGRKMALVDAAANTEWSGSWGGETGEGGAPEGEEGAMEGEEGPSRDPEVPPESSGVEKPADELPPPPQQSPTRERRETEERRDKEEAKGRLSREASQKRNSVVGASGEEPKTPVTITLTTGGQTFAVNTIPSAADQLVREGLIKKHFEAKMNNLLCQLQALDGETQKWQDESAEQRERARRLELEKAELEKEKEAWIAAVEEEKERLATTERSYAHQLNLMTEHICSLNAKISELDSHQQQQQQQQQQQHRKGSHPQKAR